MPAAPVRNIYYNLGAWFLIYLPLAYAAFYTTYISVFNESRPAMMHIHFAVMALWMMLVIIQPFLIKYKKTALHRLLGKASYFVAPLVLLTGYAMLRMGYFKYADYLSSEMANGQPVYSHDQVLNMASVNIAIAFFYMAWFAVFYILAIKNKRKSFIHARYMLATALTLTGPTVDRIFFIRFNMMTIFGKVPAEYVSFLIIDLVILILLILDIRNKKNIRPLFTSLAIYLAGQFLYAWLPGTQAWEWFTNLIIQP